MSDTIERFRAPKNRPNNVSSRVEPSDPHYIAPYAGGDDPVARFAALKDAVRRLGRVVIVTDEPVYLHAVTRSPFFRFPDDNEFELVGDIIHVKCAARLGYRDFDANRKRAEALRSAIGASASA